MDYFSESTDRGKLYINYPTVESFKHFKSIPDEEYLFRKIHIDDFNDRSYKQIVGEESCCTDLRRYSREDFNYIISESIKKAEYIETQKLSENIRKSYANINEKCLLERKNDTFEEEKVIPVLNTSLYFICDYNIKLITMSD